MRRVRVEAPPGRKAGTVHQGQDSVPEMKPKQKLKAPAKPMKVKKGY